MSGISNITVVTGYKHDRASRASRFAGVVRAQRALQQVEQPLLAVAGARHASPGAIVMNSDILVSPMLIARLLAATGARCRAHRSAQDHLGAEEMKVRLSNGFIAEFSKDCRSSKASGENVGILKFSREGGTRLAHHLDTLVHIGMTNAWAPLAFGALAREWPLVAVSTHGIPWTEIDFPEDLARAEQVLAPQLAARGLTPVQEPYSRGADPVRDRRMKMFAAAAIGVALFMWTIASVGLSTRRRTDEPARRHDADGDLLAAVRFALQAAGWRLAMASAPETAACCRHFAPSSPAKQPVI